MPYIERKPPEVDAHLLHAGHQFAVEADLDALTPEALVVAGTPAMLACEPAGEQPAKG